MTQITIRAYVQGGGRQLNMWTVIRRNGSVVKRGFTPLTYSGSPGTYAAELHDYKALSFQKWANNLTGNTRTQSLSDSARATWVAYYTEGAKTQESEPAPAPSTGGGATKTGVYFALYKYPGSSGSWQWDAIRKSKVAHPSVPFLVTFNPNSGPGTRKDGNFATWVKRLQDAGITMIGYQADDYGSRSMSAMKDAARKYHDWYGADGLFLDEVTNKPEHENRYREITDYCKSIGMKFTMGNPGTDVPTSFVGALTCFNTSEGAGYTSTSDPNIVGASWVRGGTTGWHSRYDKANFSVMRYDCSWLNSSYVLDVMGKVGYILITSGNDSNGRWFNIPSYWNYLVALLDR